MKTYRLSDFSVEEIGKAKSYVAAAAIGLIRLKANDYIDEMFEKLKLTEFTKKDTIEFSFEITTTGNDILAAIGAAKEQLEKKNG